MVIILIIGTVVTVTGYLITFRNNLDLIVGDPEVIHRLGNKARYPTGIAALLIGLLLIGYAVFGYLNEPVLQGASLMFVFAVVVVFTVIFIFVSKPIHK